MKEEMLKRICEKLTQMHEGDERQLAVIFSKEDRILVEAPAGYGKTTTMISRLAYLITTDAIPYPKKILALTFSVNAALKIKREVAEKLPILLGKQNNPNYVSSKLTISNYHGFCKSVLKKYGYLLSGFLKNLDDLQAIGDEEISKLPDTRTVLTADENLIVTEVNNIIMQSDEINEDTFRLYNDIIAKKLFPIGKITHNAIILLTLQLFRQYPHILKFYQKYFPLIVIDEYQDTNIISWELIDNLITDNTKLLLIGDSLQRIYGFIGAYPNIMNISANNYKMTTIVLNKNYRFRNNPEMLKLDNNIRKNAINFNSPDITETASLPYFYSELQNDEGSWIANKILRLFKEDSSAKLAVLVKGRGVNTDIIEKKLQENQIDYFYALYKDNDEDYIAFHRTCLEIFDKTINKRSSISRENLSKFVNKVKDIYKNDNSKVFRSMISLLEVLVERVIVDYGNLEPEDRKSLLKDIFENRQLKQAMEYIPSNVILSTIHGAKGLEWDYVILADLEKSILPFYETCKYCEEHHFCTTDGIGCSITETIDEEMEKRLLEELCVFYVAITRAKKQVYITSSSEKFNAGKRRFDNSVLSCLPLLKGILLIPETLEENSLDDMEIDEDILTALRAKADL
ncbi:MAG: ATP-dependent helicase UvrD/PcrA [Thermoanaerobacterium sp.]|nr:ATP-dependent helicase UvrD/PcrA [Thermoanaerobacterium sp.]MDN5315931.1 ATP-dependent helicase UvrD/PcrA [Thermoanaerobacterium sp.]